MRYDAFGGITWLDTDFSVKSESDYDWNRTFTGQVLDDETGLMLYRMRYYSTALGRFVSRDPIEYQADDENLYRYVWNNSILHIDFDGFRGGAVHRPVYRPVQPIRRPPSPAYYPKPIKHRPSYWPSSVPSNPIPSPIYAPTPNPLDPYSFPMGPPEYRIPVCIDYGSGSFCLPGHESPSITPQEACLLKELKKKRCDELNDKYHNPECQGCDPRMASTYTKKEIENRIKCFESQIALRQEFLDLGCIMEGLAEEIADAIKGHEKQIREKRGAIKTCKGILGNPRYFPPIPGK